MVFAYSALRNTRRHASKMAYYAPSQSLYASPFTRAVVQAMRKLSVADLLHEICTIIDAEKVS